MKREDLFKAIGEVDDSLLDENVAPDQPAIWRWIGGIATAAACVAVVLGTAGWAKLHQRPPVQKLPEATAASETQETDATVAASMEVPAETETLLASAVEETQVTTLSTIEETIVESSDVIETTETAGAENTEDVSWQAAYRELLSKKMTPDGNVSLEEMNGALVYVDEDDIPELLLQGYSIDYLYTWKDGVLYTLMDGWGYGVMGNAGYDYIPGKNALYNHNSDYAGMIGYDTYFHIGETHEFVYDETLKTCVFKDTNSNGEVDGDDELEYDEAYTAYYLDDEPITPEEAQPYFDRLADYEPLMADLTYADLMEKLQP